MRKNIFWFVMIMLLVFTSLNSGCGGSSDGGNVFNQNTQSQDVTPNNPTNPDTHNTPTTTYDFSTLTGTWTPSNGSGTASGNGVNATMTLKGGQVSLTNATSNGNVDVSANIRWDAVQGSSVLVSDVRDNFGGSGSKTFTHVSGNTWRLSGTDSDGAYSTTITITSATTATVERDGYYSDDDFSGVHFHMTYTITKQSTTETPNTPTPDTPATISFTTLTGTWAASNGSGTVTGTVDGMSVNTTMSLRAGSNTITFSNVNVSGSTATLEASLNICMDIAGSSEVWEDEFGGGKAEYTGVLTFQNTDGNTWSMERTGSHNNTPHRTTITFTSSTTAQVERYDGGEPTINASYTLTKQ